MPLPDSFWKTRPAPPKIPAPSFFCSPTEISTSGVLHVGLGLDHEVVRRVDLQLADHSRQLGREGDEAAVGRRGVLGEEQLAAAEDALEATP